MQPKRGLGRGLASLIRTVEEISMPLDSKELPSPVRYIPITKVKEGPFQPRRDTDEQSISALTESVAQFGVLEPLLVRAVEGGLFQIVAGHRRFLAATRANLEEVPAVVLSITDEEALVLSLVENLQREDLNPIEEAEAFYRLVNEFGFTHERIASYVGRSRTYVTNTLRLLNLPEKVKALIRSGKISRGQAIALLSLSAETLGKVLPKVLEGGMSVRQIELLGRSHAKAKDKARTERKTPKLIPGLLAIVEQLSNYLGTRVRIVPRNGEGTIELVYYSTEDLYRIARLILPSENPF